MTSNRFSREFFAEIITLLLLTVSPLNQANEIHKAEKRQIGVLARTGALPQGKRSVEVLARNGELPPLISGKPSSSSDQTLDQLIQELESAESLSRLRIQALTERFFEEVDRDNVGDLEKRSVSALARNGELPQKRLTEAFSRSGYLIKPPQETVQTPRDLFDADDFLAGGLPAAKRFFLGNTKSSWGKIPFGKRNLNSLARDGGLSALKQQAYKQKDWDDGFDFDDFHDDHKKNVGASKNFGKRETRGNCLESTKGNEKDSSRRMKRSPYIERTQEDYEGPFSGDEFDYQDFPGQFYRSQDSIEKRFLGRIPQLGRMHQKVQSPSSRRRPHLRPNWL